MTKQSYSDKLKDPRWQRKRLEVYQRDNWTCLSCNNNRETLDVHHLKYFPGLDPWDYEMCYLITYCKTCHNSEHLMGDKIRQIHLEVLKEHPMFIKPLAQVTNLITEFPPFYEQLKKFLNEMIIHHLRSKETFNAYELER